MLARFRRLLTLVVVLAVAPSAGRAFAQPNSIDPPNTTDPLPSWNGGPAKNAILTFVRETTQPATAKFVPAEERIVTFDQDGTLWVEHPMYTQVVYCLDRVPAVVKQKPGLKDVEPFKTVLSGDEEAIAKLPLKDLEEILAATLTGMTAEEFQADVKAWLGTARHRRWNRPYTELTYQPMLELLTYFRVKRIQDVHRDRRGSGFRARLCRKSVRHSSRAGRRNDGRSQIRLRPGRAAGAHEGAETPAQRQQRRQARGDPPDDRPPAARRLRELDRRSRDAGVHGSRRRRSA